MQLRSVRTPLLGLGLAGLLLTTAACGPAVHGAASHAVYLPAQGTGVSANDQDGKPFALGRMLKGTVATSSLHLPKVAANGSIAFTATPVARDPSLDPALTDPAWRKAGGFCLPAADGNFAGYPDTTTPNPDLYQTCGYALYSKANLSLAFVVADPHPNYFVSKTAWEDAAVELYMGVNGQNEQWMNDLGVLAAGAKVGPVTSVPGARMAAALTNHGYIIVLRIPWATIAASPTKGTVIPLNIQTDAPNAAGSSDFYYYANGTKPAGAAVSTFGSLTLG